MNAQDNPNESVAGICKSWMRELHDSLHHKTGQINGYIKIDIKDYALSKMETYIVSVEWGDDYFSIDNVLFNLKTEKFAKDDQLFVPTVDSDFFDKVEAVRNCIYHQYKLGMYARK